MSKFLIQVDHVPAPKEFEETYTGLYARLLLAGIKDIHLWDSKYFYVAHVDWGKIFKDVLLNMPKYIVDKFDCENAALLTSARVSERYKLNTCGIAIGQSPMDYHGFNIFLSEFGLHYLEPQTGQVFAVDEKSGYKAELVIFG